MKTNVITMFLALAVAMPVAYGDATDRHTVSGTVQIVGSRVKTVGVKSDKEVVVYLQKVGEQVYPAAPAKSALLDQAGLVFVPHVLAIQKGTIVDFVNSDTTDHNVFCVDECCQLVEDINSKKPKFLDLGNFPGGEKGSHRFNMPGEGVMLCKLHPEMAAYIIVLESPYFTVAEIDETSQSASFTIANVPPGKYIVKTWNKRCESPDTEITVGDDGAGEILVELQRKQRKKKRR